MRYGDHSLLARKARSKWLVGAIGFGGIAGPVLLLTGLQSVSASVSALLLNLESVFTALLAWIVFRENFDRRIALGMLLIVLGGLALAWTPGEKQISTGAIWVATACFCWGVDNNLTRKVAANDAMTIACIKGLGAGAVNIGIAFAVAVGAHLPSWTGITSAAIVGFAGYGPLCASLGRREPVRTSLWLRFSAPSSRSSCNTIRYHKHGADSNGVEPHTHVHEHQPLRHAHAHFPDIHHRHEH